MTALDTVADRQAQWSKTANSMKSMIDKARWWVFLFGAGSGIGSRGEPVGRWQLGRDGSTR